MTLIILYLMVAAMAGSLISRFKDWKSWSVDAKVLACIGFGGLWVFTLPMALAVVTINKVLDKFTKV